jgi:hypothetical protein
MLIAIGNKTQFAMHFCLKDVKLLLQELTCRNYEGGYNQQLILVVFFHHREISAQARIHVGCTDRTVTHILIMEISKNYLNFKLVNKNRYTVKPLYYVHTRDPKLACT